MHNSDVATLCAQDELAQFHVRAIRITANYHLPPSNIYLLCYHCFNPGDLYMVTETSKFLNVPITGCQHLGR